MTKRQNITGNKLVLKPLRVTDLTDIKGGLAPVEGEHCNSQHPTGDSMKTPCSTCDCFYSNGTPKTV